VFGEVRVSRQLLDGEISRQTTDFFRAGHLRVPDTPPEALQRSSGIVDRSVFPDTPPRVVHTVTPLGESLRPLLEEMCHWGESHSAAMALKKLRASDRGKIECV
jgi:hypothetical protein